MSFSLDPKKCIQKPFPHNFKTSHTEKGFQKKSELMVISISFFQLLNNLLNYFQWAFITFRIENETPKSEATTLKKENS